MDRRGFLKIVAGGGVATVVGTRVLSSRFDQIHRLRGVNTPLRLIVFNAQTESRSTSLRIERDHELVFRDTVTVEADGSREVAAFHRAGRYSAVAESGELRSRFDDARITWEQLADCNSLRLLVVLEEDRLDATITYTEMHCPTLFFGTVGA